MIMWGPNKAIDIGEWYICGGGQSERFYCMCISAVKELHEYNYLEPIIHELCPHLISPWHSNCQLARLPTSPGCATWPILPHLARPHACTTRSRIYILWVKIHSWMPSYNAAWYRICPLVSPRSSSRTESPSCLWFVNYMLCLKYMHPRQASNPCNSSAPFFPL